jgi:hypothetical protein
MAIVASAEFWEQTTMAGAAPRLVSASHRQPGRASPGAATPAQRNCAQLPLVCHKCCSKRQILALIIAAPVNWTWVDEQSTTRLSYERVDGSFTWP